MTAIYRNKQGNNDLYNLLFIKKRKTIQQLCDLAQLLESSDDNYQSLCRIIRRYNARNCGKDLDISTYTLNHPGDLKSYFSKSQDLLDEYHESEYFKNLPNDDLTKNWWAHVGVGLLCVGTGPFMAAIVTTYCVAPAIFLPIMMAGIAYFIFAALLICLNDTHVCAHDEPIFPEKTLTNMMNRKVYQNDNPGFMAEEVEKATAQP